MLLHDHDYMDMALRAALEAGRAGDVPIGAVVVHEGEIVAIAANRREQDQDPTAHAEILALQEAGRRLGSWRLTDCTLFVTLEPCPMCMGAAINARLSRLVFACRDQKAGAAVTLFQLGNDPRLNHRLIVTEGVRRHQASALLTGFFASLRAGEREVPEQLPADPTDGLRVGPPLDYTAHAREGDVVSRGVR
jgi:tRNA(adenine34) deaminase